MITNSNYRFLALGLLVGFAMAVALFAPKKPGASAPTAPKMTVVMNTRNIAPAAANTVIIPAAPVKEMFPVKLEIRPRSVSSELDRAMERVAQQKYHLIYREIPPIQ